MEGTTADWREIAHFYALALLGALACGALWWASEGPLVQMAVGVLYMWTPGLATLLLRARKPDADKPDLGLSLGRLPWLLVGLLGPLAFYLLLLGWGLLLPGVTWAPQAEALLVRLADQLDAAQLDAARAQLSALPAPPWLLGLAGLVPGAFLNAPAALGEELGWRGYLHGALAPLGAARRAAITGLCWGLWHAPLILQGYNFPDSPRLGVLVMIAGCTALSPLMGALRQRSGSLWAPVLFHGGLNAGGQVALTALDGNGLVVHPLGLLGILAALSLGLLLWASGRGAGDSAHRADPPAHR